MGIPSYQVRNVLNQYSEKLSAGTIKADPYDGQGPGFSSWYGLTEEKRMEIIDRTTTGIVNNITRFNGSDRTGQLIEIASERNPSGCWQSVGLNETQFVFNAIDENNQKVTTTVSFEDTGYLIKRFEKQVSEAVDHKPEKTS